VGELLTHVDHGAVVLEGDFIHESANQSEATAMSQHEPLGSHSTEQEAIWEGFF
jgi:hypothetical protein